MIVLGIDSSTSATGWAVLELEKNGKTLKDQTPYNKNATIICSGVIRPDEDLDYLHKVTYVMQEIEKIINQYLPMFIVIEEVSVMRNMKIIRMLSGLITVLQVTACRKGIISLVAIPSQWRKHLQFPKADRKGYKKLAIEYVRAEFGIDAPEDEAEAICIAKYGEIFDIVYT